MAKCWYCKERKGKRYCSPIDNVLCPVCCAKNRLVNIECNEDCKYLKGVEFQQEKEEKKEFSKLIENVPHGQYDDIFQIPAVAVISFEIESFIRSIYIEGEMRITDKSVFESYKKIYKHYSKDEKIEADKSDTLTKRLLNLFESNIGVWEKDMDKALISQLFLRLMLSIQNMTGGYFGEFGYLNYLKNNLLTSNAGDNLILEDKFGNKVTRDSSRID